MGVRTDRVCDRVRFRTRAMVRMVQPGQVGAWPRVVPPGKKHSCFLLAGNWCGNTVVHFYFIFIFL